jgi:hypothetical protein
MIEISILNIFILRFYLKNSLLNGYSGFSLRNLTLFMISSPNYNPHQKYVLAHRACTLMVFGGPIPILLASVIGLVLNFEDCAIVSG